MSDELLDELVKREVRSVRKPFPLQSPATADMRKPPTEAEKAEARAYWKAVDESLKADKERHADLAWGKDFKGPRPKGKK